MNVGFAEMVDYLVEDPDTRVIALYVEGIDDPKHLLAAARENAGKKPVVAYKTGSGTVGDAAARSHTGSLAGRHEIYTDAFKQAGILVVNSAQSLLDTAKALAACPIPSGPGVAVLSGQAGPSMAACDVCESRGLDIVRFSQKTQNRINELLPPLALRTNPVDMGPAWYDSSAIQGIVRAVMEDEKRPRNSVPDDVCFRQRRCPGRHQRVAETMGPEKAHGELHPVARRGSGMVQIQDLESREAVVKLRHTRAGCKRHGQSLGIRAIAKSINL